MELLALTLATLIYTLYDYLGYNAAQNHPTPALRNSATILYRHSQALLALLILFVLFLLKAYNALLAFIVFHFTFVHDALYYIWAYGINPPHMENRRTVHRILSKPTIPHARWTFVGIFTIQRTAILIQVVVGFLSGLLLVLIRPL